MGRIHKDTAKLPKLAEALGCTVAELYTNSATA